LIKSGSNEPSESTSWIVLETLKKTKRNKDTKGNMLDKLSALREGKGNVSEGAINSGMEAMGKSFAASIKPLAYLVNKSPSSLMPFSDHTTINAIQNTFLHFLKLRL